MLGQEIKLPSVGDQQNLVNENYKVDANRGVQIRFTSGAGGMPPGMAVYMYWDRPGFFLNDHAKPVPLEVAEAAGYDVEPLMKARRKQEAFAKAKSEIEAQYQEGLGTHEVVEETEEYRLVHIGNDQFIVEFEDGSNLTPTPVSKEMATKAFRSMAGIPEPAPAPVKK